MDPTGAVMHIFCPEASGGTVTVSVNDGVRVSVAAVGNLTDAQMSLRGEELTFGLAPPTANTGE